MCVSVTVTHIYTTTQRQCVLSEAYFKHSPRLSMLAVVMSAYLLLFFTLLLIRLPQDLKGMAVPTKQHIYILMCIHFIHLISHMAQEYKYTLVISQHAIILTSLLHIVFFCLWCGPLQRAKQWHNDIERSSEPCVYRMKEEKGEKRLHPYSISSTGLE